jgi:hypothetical protein
MKRWTTLYLILGITAVTLAQKPSEPSPEPPPPEPISMQVIGKRVAVLDRGGRTADAYSKDVAAGRLTPSPLSCDLSLRITNNTKGPIRIRATGSTNRLTLSLEGKAMTGKYNSARPRPRITYEAIKPGASYTIPLTELAGYYNTNFMYPVPTEAGEYKLKAELRLYIYPDDGTGRPIKGKGKKAVALPPLGAPGAFRAGLNTLTAPPFKLTVKVK